MQTKPDALKRLSDLLDGIAQWSGRLVAWMVLCLVLVTFAVVVLRYAFDTGWIAMQESISYLHAMVFMLGAAYTLQQEGHVRVDILYRKWPPRTRAWVDIMGTLIFLLPVCGFILWISWDYVASSWQLQEGSQEAGGLGGVFLLKSTIPLMALLLILQGIATLLHKVQLLRGLEAETRGGTDQEL